MTAPAPGTLAALAAGWSVLTAVAIYVPYRAYSVHPDGRETATSELTWAAGAAGRWLFGAALTAALWALTFAVVLASHDPEVFGAHR